ncbi:MAG: hypothetical protein ACD_67C00230G0008 [uncultured bacterium]|nr:MAG: hypothetical protein ACD_67C00230G0008 [uncultured bacterium]
MGEMAMILRGTDFGPIWGASGATNFDGRGWRQHKFFRVISPQGFNLEGLTETGKTMTLLPRDGKSPGQGNMPLDDDLQPSEMKPKCIRVFPLLCVCVNAVGLTGWGAVRTLELVTLHEKTKPHVLSFMSLAASPEERIAEFKQFKAELKKRLHKFKGKIALTINISCPNTNHSPKDIEKDWRPMLNEAQDLDIPVGIKFGPEITGQTIFDVDQSGLADYVVVSNTLKVGNEVEGFSWRWAFGLRSFVYSLLGKMYSPLKKFGGGGYSGPKLRPINIRTIEEARALGAKIPIMACGGISKPRHLVEYVEAGANGAKVGTALILRFWKMASLIKTAHEIF